MKCYKQLTSEQRYQISGLHKADWIETGIADEVGVRSQSRILHANLPKWHDLLELN